MRELLEMYTEFVKLNLFLTLQELQRDVDDHLTDVMSVRSLCNVLIADCNSRNAQCESYSVSKALQNLDIKWSTIEILLENRRKM